MQFVRYTDGTSPSWGIKKETTIHALSGLPQEEPTLADLSTPSYRSQVAILVENGALTQVDADSVSLLAPIPWPGKIVCCGLNYRDHAEKQNEEIPEQPMLFGKAATSVTNPGDPIVHPNPDGDEQVDYEFDPNNVDIEMRVDGEVKQSSNTEQFIFNVGELVSYISQSMTLRAGDVILTGMPGGIGIFRDPIEVLEPGQTTEAEIEGIGTLTNTVVSE